MRRAHGLTLRYGNTTVMEQVAAEYSRSRQTSRVLPAASFSCAWMGHGWRIDSAVAEYGTDQSATSSGKPDCNIEERIVDFNVPVHLS